MNKNTQSLVLMVALTCLAPATSRAAMLSVAPAPRGFSAAFGTMLSAPGAARVFTPTVRMGLLGMTSALPLSQQDLLLAPLAGQIGAVVLNAAAADEPSAAQTVKDALAAAAPHADAAVAGAIASAVDAAMASGATPDQLATALNALRPLAAIYGADVAQRAGARIAAAVRAYAAAAVSAPDHADALTRGTREAESAHAAIAVAGLQPGRDSGLLPYDAGAAAPVRVLAAVARPVRRSPDEPGSGRLDERAWQALQAMAATGIAGAAAGAAWTVFALQAITPLYAALAAFAALSAVFTFWNRIDDAKSAIERAVEDNDGGRTFLQWLTSAALTTTQTLSVLGLLAAAVAAGMWGSLPMIVAVGAAATLAALVHFAEPLWDMFKNIVGFTPSLALAAGLAAAVWSALGPIGAALATQPLLTAALLVLPGVLIVGASILFSGTSTRLDELPENHSFDGALNGLVHGLLTLKAAVIFAGYASFPVIAIAGLATGNLVLAVAPLAAVGLMWLIGAPKGLAKTGLGIVGFALGLIPGLLAVAAVAAAGLWAASLVGPLVFAFPQALAAAVGAAIPGAALLALNQFVPAMRGSLAALRDQHDEVNFLGGLFTALDTGRGLAGLISGASLAAAVYLGVSALAAGLIGIQAAFAAYVGLAVLFGLLALAAVAGFYAAIGEFIAKAAR